MSKVTDWFEDRFFDADNWTKAYLELDVKELLAHARALEDMLRKHEFVTLGSAYDWTQVTECPECSGNTGHAPDCALAKLLE